MTKFEHNRDFFKDINELSAYWAGFVAADGCIKTDKRFKKLYYSLRINLKYNEYNQVLQFKKDIKAYDNCISFNTGSQKTKNGFITYTAGCNVEIGINKEELLYLSTWGISNINKSFSLLPPNEELNLTYNQKLAYIKGLIDGDGCISLYSDSKYPVCRIVGTYKVLEWIKDLFPSSHSVHKHGSIWCYQVPKANHLEIKNSIPYRGLERKWNKVKEIA